MKTHKHKWKVIGFYDAGFGISSSCKVYWCPYCGATNKGNRTTNPKKIVSKGKKIL